MREKQVLAKVFMLVNKHGDVVIAEPGQSRRAAWANVRAKYGAHGALQFKRRGYLPEEVQIITDMRSEWRWQLKSK